MPRRSYYAAGGRSSAASDDKSWTPRVDKDPFHRTMAIFNGVFKKKIRLSAGKTNCTDLHTIFINFGELRPSRIFQVIRDGSSVDHSIFLLECGHEWEGRKVDKNGVAKTIGKDYGMCGFCGADTIYRGFEHEWQHIIFKSDLAARKIFVDAYTEQLLTQAPGVDRKELTDFLHMLVNAFDDLRVNSLWEKVYQGSAMAIWDRWRNFTFGMGDYVNTSFLAYIFAVAFAVPTDPQGEFEPMRPVIELAIQNVKYRGHNNMLLDVRVVMDRCMGALLAKMKPAPPPQGAKPPAPPSLTLPPPPSPGGSSQDDSDGESNQQQGNDDAQEDDSQSSDQEDQDSGSQSGQEDHQALGTIGSGKEGQRDQEDEQGTQGDPNVQDSAGQATSQPSDVGDAATVNNIPSAATLPATGQERTDALSRLIQNPQKLDDKEDHSDPTAEDLEIAKKSQALRAALNSILHQDITDLSKVGLASEPAEKPDADMQAQIDQLQSGVVEKTESSQLTDDAKAKVTIIEVTRDGTGSSPVVLEADERAIIQRLRAAFFKSMGRQKSKRSSTGTSVDVEALIQYLGDFQDPNVFENEDINQGFAYSVVCDMSGSMVSSFPIVCKAVEMLKQALNFPFVMGNLWGFRGGEPMMKSAASSYGSGEVWMYRYARDVHWYTGTTPHRLFPGPSGLLQVPVKCGGITPMNAAINVATNHLWRKMPAGMAKRMFLLTDGSPVQTKVTGRLLPEFMLRQFVANEVKKARKHGIEVYTTIIGENSIDDDKCLQMFGPKKFWNKVGHDRVGTVLLSLVLRNFNRYLRRG